MEPHHGDPYAVNPSTTVLVAARPNPSSAHQPRHRVLGPLTSDILSLPSCRRGWSDRFAGVANSSPGACRRPRRNLSLSQTGHADAEDAQPAATAINVFRRGVILLPTPVRRGIAAGGAVVELSGGDERRRMLMAVGSYAEQQLRSSSAEFRVGSSQQRP